MSVVVFESARLRPAIGTPISTSGVDYPVEPIQRRMFRADATFYLPISDRALRLVLDDTDNAGFLRIDRMLSKGYDLANWIKASGRMVAHHASGSAVGLIEDVRNREFDTVMLAPDVVDHAWNTKHTALAAASSAIYVAVTRAQRRLIVPKQ